MPQVANFRRHTQGGTPGSEGNSLPGIPPVRLVSRRFAWKGMAADVAAWMKDCQHCQRKGDCAAGGGGKTNSGSRLQILLCTRGPGGPLAYICSWVFLHLLSCRQVNKEVGSYYSVHKVNA
jgi:hypothetical protein